MRIRANIWYLIGRLNQPAADGFLSLRAFKPSSSDSADRGRSIIQVTEVITAIFFYICHNNKQFIPRVYMFINHKMTHRYIYFRFTRHALQLHHATMLNYLHGYKRLCCQNLAYRQTEIKWSFVVEHLNA
jgi:hypothetical protein